MTVASNLGFPRIGHWRELKTALEQFWTGDLDETGLKAAGNALRTKHWKLQTGLGINHVPSGDFSFYDHVLDTACMLGVIPPGYGWSAGPVSLATYFALARGSRGSAAEKAADIAPNMPVMEMTKWFDTNYHYLVPLLSAGQRFTLTSNQPLEQFREAAALSIRTRPVLLGPVSFLLLAKATDGSNQLDLLADILPLYSKILAELAEAGAAWVQMDEPCLALDLTEQAKSALVTAYTAIATNPTPQLLLTSYFGPLQSNLDMVTGLPVAGHHIDLVRGRDELNAVLQGHSDGPMALARPGRRAQRLANRPARRAWCSATGPRGTR